MNVPILNGSDSLSRSLRVLSLDGGAIRGYYTARLIERLVVSSGRDPARADVGARFDLIVGTSAGAILGASLAAGVPIARVCALYRSNGPAIFRSPSPLGWTALLWSMRHWRRPPADAGALRHALDSSLGGETLGELYARRRIALCMTSTDVTTSRARVFATPHRDRHAGDRSLGVVDACIASASAPMLLAPASLRDDNVAKWSDGGIWATSPLLVAVSEAIELAGERAIDVVSIGSCPVPLGVEVTRERATGLAFWTRGLRALQVGADAQAHATIDLLEPLVVKLCGRVRVMRLADPEPDPRQAAELRLDNASPAAFAAMDALADRAVAINAGNPAVELLTSAVAN